MKKQTWLCLLGAALTVMIFSVLPSQAATYHVAVVGNDTTGTGTTAKPFASIPRGTQAAVSGDTVCVGAGTYWIPLVYDQAMNQSVAIVNLSKNGITYKKEPTAATHPMVSFPTRTANKTFLEITGSNIVWDGIDVNNGLYGIYAHGGANLTIQNCTVQWSQYPGIQMENYNQVVIDNCDVHDCVQMNSARDGLSGLWSTGIGATYSSYVTVKNSRVHNNCGEGIDPYLGCSNWTIDHNTVYDNFSVNIYVDTDAAQASITVSNNTIYDTGTLGSGDHNLPTGIRVGNENADFNPPSSSINAVVKWISIHDNVIQNCGGGLESFAYYGGPYRLADSSFYNNQVSGSRNHSDGTAFAAVTIFGIVSPVTYAYNYVTGGAVNIDSAINSYGNY